MNKYTISRRIEKEAKKQGMSQAELARRTGLNSGTISRYINGKLNHGMTAKNIRKIADALGVSCKDLGMMEDER